MKACFGLNSLVSELDLLFLYFGTDRLHLVHHLLLFVLERRELVPLRLRVLLGHFHVTELLYFVAACFDNRACLHQCLLDFRSELLIVEVRAYLPVVVLQCLDLLLNRLQLCFNLLFLLLALAAGEGVPPSVGFLVPRYFGVHHALAAGFLVDCVRHYLQIDKI